MVCQSTICGQLRHKKVVWFYRYGQFSWSQEKRKTRTNKDPPLDKVVFSFQTHKSPNDLHADNPSDFERLPTLLSMLLKSLKQITDFFQKGMLEINLQYNNLLMNPT